jgi:hypothetical protein
VVVLVALRWLFLVPIGLFLVTGTAPVLVAPNIWSSGEVGDPVYSRWEAFRYVFHLSVLGVLMLLPPRLYFQRSSLLIVGVVGLVAWELALDCTVPAARDAVRWAIIGSAALLLLFVVLRSEQRAEAERGA